MPRDIVLKSSEEEFFSDDNRSHSCLLTTEIEFRDGSILFTDDHNCDYLGEILPKWHETSDCEIKITKGEACLLIDEFILDAGKVDYFKEVVNEYGN